MALLGEPWPVALRRLVWLCAFVAALGWWAARRTEFSLYQRQAEVFQERRLRVTAEVASQLLQWQIEAQALALEPGAGETAAWLAERTFDPDEPDHSRLLWSRGEPSLDLLRQSREQIVAHKRDPKTSPCHRFGEAILVTVAAPDDRFFTVVHSVAELTAYLPAGYSLEGLTVHAPPPPVAPAGPVGWWGAIPGALLLLIAFLASRAPTSVGQPDETPVLDPESVLARVGGRVDHLQALVELFRQSSRHDLAALQAALRAGDADQVQRLAHSLKGSVAVFSASPAVEAALALERLGREGDLSGARPALARLEHELARLEGPLEQLLRTASGQPQPTRVEDPGRVLVVEDDSASRLLLSQALRSSGHQVLEASSCEQARVLLEQESVDAIVLDVLLPGSDGFSFCRELKADATRAMLPVILVTALQERSDRLEGMLAGADDFLSKPIDGREVALRLSNAVRSKRLYDRLQDSYAQLVQSAKLAAVGQLAAGLAHELNTPLAAIQLALDAAVSLLPPEQKAVLGLLGRAEKAGDQAARLVAKLLHYARDSLGGRVTADLRSITADAVDLVNAQLRLARITVEVKQPEQPLMVHCVVGEIQQIITNLLLNARDAVGGDSRVEVELDEHLGGARLRVRDPGPGVPAPVAARIFEPFFTTKPVGEGTGLGLSISGQIAQAHEGSLELVSEDGWGAVFALWLPQVESP